MFERPPNCPVYTECIITGVLQLFYTSVYFTQGLSDSDTCHVFAGPPPDDVTWTSGPGSPSDEDHEDPIWTSVVTAAQDLRCECRSRGPVKLKKGLA
jgi:hypothetical protein